MVKKSKYESFIGLRYIYISLQSQRFSADAGMFSAVNPIPMSVLYVWAIREFFPLLMRKLSERLTRLQ